MENEMKGNIFINFFRYALLGFRVILINPLLSIFNVSSSGVDRVYKGTKKVLKINNKENKSNSILQKDISDLFAPSEAKLKKMKMKLSEELASEESKRLSKPTVFRYLARNPKGKIIRDNFTGSSKLDVNAFLVNEGYEVFSIETSGWINFMYGDSGVFAKKMKNKDLIFWLTQLSTYVKSGIPLTDSMRILANQMGKDKGRKRVFDSIVYELTMGEAFSKALEKQGAMFPSLLINMLKAAEATGELEETLDDMANYYSEIESTRRQMISALTYPSILLVFAIAVITFIMVYVIPQFTQIYASLGTEVNGLTKTIVSMSHYLSDNIFSILLVVMAIIVGFMLLYKNIKAFRKAVQIILMKTPVIGKVVIYNEMAIFTKTFSSLLRNNVFITESIDILSKITNNEVYKEIMFDTIKNIATGGKISETFADNWAIPEVAYYMIVTGESTGELAEMMGTVSVYYQEQHRMVVTSLKSFVEPVMIVILAIIVGVVIISVITPMYGMYDAISM